MKKDKPKTKLTAKQARRLENIVYGLERNNISIQVLSEQTKLHYTTIYAWVKGWFGKEGKNVDKRLDIIEEAYAKVMHLDYNDKPVKAEDVIPEATEVVDVAKVTEAMDEIGLTIQQVIALSKCKDLTEEFLNAETNELSKQSIKKLEKLFDKPKGFFLYVEPEPVVEAQESQEPPSTIVALEEDDRYKLQKCQEELAEIKEAIALLRENFLNFVKAFSNVEDSNAEIYKMVKEIHFDLTKPPLTTPSSPLPITPYEITCQAEN